MSTLDAINLLPFEGTAFAHEGDRIAAGEPWCTTHVAGLQFYDYGTEDEFVGSVIPQTGDAISLMRRPDNAADRRAIEVWWRNRFMLGHIPREAAYVLAPLMDEGKSVRAYCYSGGTGRTWSLVLVLVGNGVEPLRARRLKGIADSCAYAIKQDVRAASLQVWPTVHPGFEELPRNEIQNRRSPYISLGEPRIPPTDAHRREHEAFEARIADWHNRRRQDALHGFEQLPAPCPGSDLEPDETMRGHQLTQWHHVPAWLKTRSQLREIGFRPAKDAMAFATKTGGYGPYELFRSHDAVPLRSVRNN